MNVQPVELFSLAVFFIGFYGLIISRNIVKSIVFIVLMETAVIMFFLSLSFGGTALLPPVGDSPEAMVGNISDPLPQALMITAVVVGLCTTAINIVMFITLFKQLKSSDWNMLQTRQALFNFEEAH